MLFYSVVFLAFCVLLNLVCFKSVWEVSSDWADELTCEYGREKASWVGFWLSCLSIVGTIIMLVGICRGIERIRRQHEEIQHLLDSSQ